MDLAQVKRAMLERLALSGISQDEAKKLGITPYTSDNKLGLPLQAPGFLIPYYTIDGKKNCHFRYRLLGPPDATGGFASLALKQPKYLQVKGSEAGVFFPPSVDWNEILHGVDEATGKPYVINITEGELKALCACKRGFPTIGLGGVWCFQNKAKKQSFLPALEAVPWENRVVNVIYDSDAVTNPQIIKAENTLAGQLLKRGALPSIVRLPGTTTAKVGLDDFLMAHDDDAFVELVDAAALWGTSRELHELNEEVVYVRDPGLIVRLENFQKISCEAFKAHQYSNRTIMVAEPTVKQPNKMVEKSAPVEWLKWPSRSEVEKISYVPGESLYVDNKLNAWPGWACEPKKGDIGPWRKLLDFLFKGLPLERRYFEQWCACPLQNPGIKMYVAAVMWGIKHGTGKSLVGYTLEKIYGSNWVELDEDTLIKRQTTGWAENRQFAMGDEVTAGEKRGMATFVKNLITRQKVCINIKYVPEFYIPDCINYYFTSNIPDGFFMDDDDRRFFINEVKGPPLPREFYRDEYKPWLESTEGPAALFHHLLSLDMTGFDPQARAMDTEAKSEMKMIARSGLGQWVRELRDTPDNILRMGSVVNNWHYATAADLLALYDPSNRTGTTLNTMTKELHNAGFEKMNKGLQILLPDSRRVVLWEVRKHPKACAKPQPKWYAMEYMKN